MNNIKIHILFNFTDNPWGGGNQFLKALRDYLVKINVYEEDYTKSDVILLNSYNNFEKALKIKLKYPHIKFIHRIDGPIYTYRDDGIFLDKVIFKLNHILSSGTIFQSNYTKDASINRGIDLYNQLDKVIINAPNPKIFYKKDKKVLGDKIKLIATSWSGNIKKGFDVYQWLDYNLDFNKYEMTFVGNSPIKFKNIILLSPINSNNLSNELRKNDIFIFASKTESCSNSLLEALHCGLPSIGFNSTSMPQIINKGGELFNRKEEIPNILTKIVNNYEYYVNNIILPNIDDIGKEYFSFCKKIKEDNKYKEFGKISFIGNLLYIKFIFIFKLLYMKFKRIFLK